jgi:hypothetical protein
VCVCEREREREREAMKIEEKLIFLMQLQLGHGREYC